MKGRSHNEFSKCHLKAYVTIFLASAQGIDALFSMSCFPTSCPWLGTFAHPYFTFKRDIFKFLLWFVTLKASLGSRQHHCPSTSSAAPPPTPVSEWVIDYSNPPTYFISAVLPAERGTWKFVEWERLLLLYLSSLSFSPPKTCTACIFSSG